MTRTIGILLYENAQPIDIIGPWEVFSLWKTILHAPIDLYLIAETEELVRLDGQITLKAHKDFAHVPPLDALIVPGGRGRLQQVNNDNLISFIQQRGAHCKYVLSICTGMFLLAKAGLLNHKTVTTYWRALPELKEDRHLKVVERRIVKSGNIWTSGGITCGIDLALAFIEEIAGTSVAGQVQLLLEYFPEEKMYCSMDTVDQLPPYSSAHGPMKAPLPAYIREHLQMHI